MSRAVSRPVSRPVSRARTSFSELAQYEDGSPPAAAPQSPHEFALRVVVRSGCRPVPPVSRGISGRTGPGRAKRGQAESQARSGLSIFAVRSRQPRACAAIGRPGRPCRAGRDGRAAATARGAGRLASTPPRMVRAHAHAGVRTSARSTRAAPARPSARGNEHKWFARPARDDHLARRRYVQRHTGVRTASRSRPRSARLTLASAPARRCNLAARNPDVSVQPSPPRD